MAFVFNIVMLIVLENILLTSKWVMISSPWIDFTWRLDIWGRMFEGMYLFEAECSMCSLIHLAFFVIRWLKNMRLWRSLFTSLIPTWRLGWLNFTLFMFFINYFMWIFLPYIEDISGWILILFFSFLIVILNSDINFIESFCLSD